MDDYETAQAKYKGEKVNIIVPRGTSPEFNVEVVKYKGKATHIFKTKWWMEIWNMKF